MRKNIVSKSFWKTATFLGFVWLLIMGESIAMIISDPTMKRFDFEPLRIIFLFLLTIITLGILGKLKLPQKESKITSEKQELVVNITVLIFTVLWTFINLEVSLKWSRMQQLEDSGYYFKLFTQAIKQLMIVIGLYPLIMSRYVKFLIIWLPIVYFVFRCELYNLDAIEASIIIIISFLTALEAAALHKNRIQVIRKGPRKSSGSSKDKSSNSSRDKSIFIFKDKSNSLNKISSQNQRGESVEKDGSYLNQSSDESSHSIGFPKEYILDKLPEGIVVISSSGRLEYLNDSVTKILRCREQLTAIEILLNLPNKAFLERKKEDQSKGEQEKPVKSLKKFQTFTENTKKNTRNSSQLYEITELEKKSPLDIKPLNWFSLHPFNRQPKETKIPNYKVEITTHPSDPKPIGGFLHHKENSAVFQSPIESLKKISSLPKSANSIGGSENDFSIATIKDLQSTQKQLLKFESFQEAADKQVYKYQEKIDKYMENIFDDEFQSDCIDVRHTVEKILKILMKLKENFIENEDQNLDNHPFSGKKHLNKGKVKYSTTGISKTENIIRKLSLCSNTSFTVESFIKIDQNTVKTIDVLLSPLFIDGEVHILLQLRDRTDREMAKRLKDINKQKNASLAAISHEFRSPLNGVLSMLETLRPQISKDLENKFLQPAFTSASTLLYLVNDILDLHQMQAKELKLVYMSCKLNEVCRNSMNMITFKAEKRGLILETFIEQDVPKVILTDPNRLQQILVNLLSNAIKFTEKGKISIHASMLSSHQIKFEVRDTGIGIEAGNLKKLFKNFGKIDLGDKSDLNPQGAGLGLCISHGLARRLNLNKSEGGLTVTSEVGKGTCFSFAIDDMSLNSENVFLPSEASLQGVDDLVKDLHKESSTTKNYSRKTELDAKSHAMSLNKLHFFSENIKVQKTCNCSEILVVDDDEFNLLAMKAQLEALNLSNLDFARNGQEAVTKFKEKMSTDKLCCKKCYSLILIDCEMPIKNGLDATREIRQLIKENCHHEHIIIGVSGHSTQEFFKKCKEVGMDDVITKPITKKQLLSFLKNYKNLNLLKGIDF